MNKKERDALIKTINQHPILSLLPGERLSDPAWYDLADAVYRCMANDPEQLNEPEKADGLIILKSVKASLKSWNGGDTGFFYYFCGTYNNLMRRDKEALSLNERKEITEGETLPPFFSDDDRKLYSRINKLAREWGRSMNQLRSADYPVIKAELDKGRSASLKKIAEIVETYLLWKGGMSLSGFDNDDGEYELPIADDTPDAQEAMEKRERFAETLHALVSVVGALDAKDTRGVVRLLICNDLLKQLRSPKPDAEGRPIPTELTVEYLLLRDMGDSLWEFLRKDYLDFVLAPLPDDALDPYSLKALALRPSLRSLTDKTVAQFLNMSSVSSYRNKLDSLWDALQKALT